MFNAYLSHAAEGIKTGKGQGRKSYQQDKGSEKGKDKIHMQRGGYLRRRIEDTIPEIYLLQALADEPLTDLRGCDLSERERVMEACRICMPQRRNRRHALSKVRHATSVQNRLVDQRRNVRQRIPRVKRTRRFPAGGQINADRVLGTPWHSVFTFPAGYPVDAL